MLGGFRISKHSHITITETLDTRLRLFIVKRYGDGKIYGRRKEVVEAALTQFMDVEEPKLGDNKEPNPSEKIQIIRNRAEELFEEVYGGHPKELQEAVHALIFEGIPLSPEIEQKLTEFNEKLKGDSVDGTICP